MSGNGQHGAYVGIKPDGTTCAVAVDMGDEGTADFIAECIKDGLVIERTTVAACRKYFGQPWPWPDPPNP